MWCTSMLYERTLQVPCLCELLVLYFLLFSWMLVYCCESCTMHALSLWSNTYLYSTTTVFTVWKWYYVCVLYLCCVLSEQHILLCRGMPYYLFCDCTLYLAYSNCWLLLWYCVLCVYKIQKPPIQWTKKKKKVNAKKTAPVLRTVFFFFSFLFPLSPCFLL